MAILAGVSALLKDNDLLLDRGPMMPKVCDMTSVSGLQLWGSTRVKSA